MKNRNINHSDDWATPPLFYQELDKEFNFDFDPCPYQNDIKKFDGLKDKWNGKKIYINPPYNRKDKEAFVIRAIEESKFGKTCVMLLPVSTSTKLYFCPSFLPPVLLGKNGL